jgi:hypothetical protein
LNKYGEKYNQITQELYSNLEKESIQDLRARIEIPQSLIH